MLTDPNFWLSAVTATVAIIALYQTHKQMKVSNKQHLFDKRVEVYLIAAELVGLYREMGPYIEGSKNMEAYWCLTKSSYFEGISLVRTTSSEHPVHEKFYAKMERLKDISAKIRLLFKARSSALLGAYIRHYQELLLSLYKYECVKNSSLIECNEDSDSFIVEFNDEFWRETVLERARDLKQLYDELDRINVLKELEKQIKLL